MPITSFPAEFLELYRRAAKDVVTVELNSNRAAHRLRARLHTLRVTMRKESHRYLTIAEGVQISVEGTTLIARPTDHTFVTALVAAGIIIGDTQDTQAGAEGPENASETDVALSRLFNGEEDE